MIAMCLLPSEVSRLVIGYLKLEALQKSYTCMLKECKQLEECRQLVEMCHSENIVDKMFRINGYTLETALQEIVSHLRGNQHELTCSPKSRNVKVDGQMCRVQKVNHLMGSELARLVLGYFKEEKLGRTYEAFLNECTYLEEYRMSLHKGLEFPTCVGFDKKFTLIYLLQLLKKNYLDMEIVWERHATPSQRERAARLQLPRNFFANEDREPARPGCIGLDPESWQWNSAHASAVTDDAETVATGTAQIPLPNMGYPPAAPGGQAFHTQPSHGILKKPPSIISFDTPPRAPKQKKVKKGGQTRPPNKKRQRAKLASDSDDSFGADFGAGKKKKASGKKKAAVDDCLDSDSDVGGYTPPPAPRGATTGRSCAPVKYNFGADSDSD